MPALPVLPPIAVPPAALQTRGAAVNDHAAAINAPPAAADAPDGGADTAGVAMSFELVLEAQIGLQTQSRAPVSEQAADAVEPNADARAPSKPADKPPTAVDAAAAMLMLPASVVVSQIPPIAAPPSTAGATNGAREGLQGGATALRVEPGNNIKTERAESGAIPDTGQSAETTAPTPANFAAAVRTLPATDATPKRPAAESNDSVASATGSALSASVGTIADRKVDAAQPNVQPQASSATLPGVVGDQRWGDGLSQRVVWMVGQDVHAAKFQVEPPQLGPVEVKVTISNDQATVSFAAPHSATREAIQTALPRLQEMLLESGVSLGNVFVGSHTPNEHEASRGNGSSSRGVSENASEIAVDPIGADRSLQVRRSVGLVDLYA